MNFETWTSYTLSIGDNAYRHVRPLALEIKEELEDFYSGYLWWRQEWTEKTGRWFIIFTYDRGPMTLSKADRIYFDTYGKAKALFDHVYRSCFLNQKIEQANPSKTPPPPPKKSSKNPRLRLL